MSCFQLPYSVPLHTYVSHRTVSFILIRLNLGQNIDLEQDNRCLGPYSAFKVRFVWLQNSWAWNKILDVKRVSKTLPILGRTGRSGSIAIQEILPRYTKHGLQFPTCLIYFQFHLIQDQDELSAMKKKKKSQEPRPKVKVPTATKSR